jgi:3-dehydroquinate dehydratase-2
MKILVLNGPNLNLLGVREPQLYGDMSLDNINKELTALGEKLGIELSFYQSNHEGDLIDRIQEIDDAYDGAILNAGGYTHTSVAIRDAILAIKKPVIEVHLSNPSAREDFRRKSYLAGAAVGSVAGFGAASYKLALIWFTLK